MATEPLRAESASINSPIVAAFIRAFEMQSQAEEESGSVSDPDQQLAWGAYHGTKLRLLECGIDSPDHAAAAALVAFDHIDHTISGYATVRDNLQVIDRSDAERELRLVREALLGIWKYFTKQPGVPTEALAPLADYYMVDKFS